MYNKLGKADEERFIHEHLDSVVEELYPKVRQYSHFLTQNSWDGDEIAQEAVIKALKHYNVDRINAPLLKRIAYHTWIDTVRRRKREEISDITEEIGLTENIDATELMDTVENLLTRFTPKQAVVLILKEAFQYRTNEIAELIGATDHGVKSILHRAKKRAGKEGIGFTTIHIESEDQEMELLSEVMYEALKSQDPTILINTIPTIHSLESESATQKLVYHSFRARSTSPSSIFRMAA